MASATKHDDEDVRRLLDAYDEVLEVIGNACRRGSVEGALRTDSLRPLFTVR